MYQKLFISISVRHRYRVQYAVCTIITIYGLFRRRWTPSLNIRIVKTKKIFNRFNLFLISCFAHRNDIERVDNFRTGSCPPCPYAGTNRHTGLAVARCVFLPRRPYVHEQTRSRFYTVAYLQGWFSG